MRLGLFALIALSACRREPEAPTPVPVAAPGPRPPIVSRILPAALERIAFVRDDGIWTIGSDGGELRRIVPPTCPGASEPAWSPDRRWIALSAAADPDTSLYPRSLLVARPDGSELRQIVPLRSPGFSLEEPPRGRVSGRVVIETAAGRRPLGHCRVASSAPGRLEPADPEGRFEAYLPVGLAWLKFSARVDGERRTAWRFVAVASGHPTDLKDVALSSDPEDVPGAPAWSADGERLIYGVSRAPGRPGAEAPSATLRQVKLDGSGDERLASLGRPSLIAGPVVRGTSVWCKASDGTILRYDLGTHGIAESRRAGLSAPDALAVSPDGRKVATLSLDPAGTRSIVLLEGESSRAILAFKAGEPAPHAMDFSPDGSRLAVDLHGAQGHSSIAILTLATGTLGPLVENGSAPVWNGR